MATIGTTAVTLLDWSRIQKPGGGVDTVIEILSETNDIVQDIPFMEGNLPTGHQFTTRTGLPAPTWRKLNYGVPQTKGETAQVTETCGILEDYAEIDVDIAKLNGNSAAWRLNQNRSHIEGMGQSLANALIYADTRATPEQILGLDIRYRVPSVTVTDIGFNMIDGGGNDTDCTSVWLIGWGSKSIHGIYPKGSQAGLMVEDLGRVTSVDSNGLMHEVYRDHYQWKCGLAIPDWRYVVRIAEIDMSLLGANSGMADLRTLMVRAIEKLPDMNGITPRFYCSRGVRTMLRIQALDKSQYTTTFENFAGRPTLTFSGIPVRRCDAILETESSTNFAGTYAKI